SSRRRTKVQRRAARIGALGWVLVLAPFLYPVQELPKVETVELQPLAAQVKRLVEAMDYLGAPLQPADRPGVERAADTMKADAAVAEIQRVLDKYCLMDIHINPESRVKVTQGPAKAELVEQGWRSFLVKVRNEAGVTAPLKAVS